MQARSETLFDFWADLRALCQRSGLEPGRARRHRGVDVAPSSKKSASGLRAGQIPSRKRNVVPRRFPSGDSRVETIGSHFQLSKISWNKGLIRNNPRLADAGRARTGTAWRREREPAP